MAARKLQTEIDRTFKRVSEGVEIFEGLYEKLQTSANQAQKEKLESDLKTQIKKLQRHRDQIKTWLQNNDIKDKKPLMENRRLIETQMERFKACEKEMKTKAFSKEGLNAAARLDPSEKAKVEMTQWLTMQVDELSRQIEGAEAEIEQALATSKKSKKASSKEDVVGQMEHQNERRAWHISRIEILMRMLENGTLEVDRVNDIKEDIAYFVESNTEEEFDEDDGIYDEFNLDDEEEAFGLKETDDADISISAPAAESPPSQPQPGSPVDNKKDEVTNQAIPSAPPAPPAPAPAPKLKEETAAKKSTKKAEMVNKDRVVTNFDQVRVPSASASPSTQPAKTATTLPPIRYATAAAAAVAPSTPAASDARTSETELDYLHEETPAAEPNALEPSPQRSEDTTAPERRSGNISSNDPRLPDALSDLVTSFESAKHKTMKRETTLSNMQRTLDSSYAEGVPDAVDSKSPQYYVPKDPYPTPHYYPQTPATIFDNPALYAKFDVDTLFYIFYYQQGTYHQYLAARELKKQSWRFHKQYLTWFQRHSQPQAITDEYEQGAYVYFDWEGSWCQRRKNDFRFEYRWLEDN
ncbi:general negative regulator of transcription subunit 5 [Malassezia yamatoensis]|uniref:General negative regulator of transcription subunit n=1 Tax=Malassezia yamatoensis TaxID=253288 RepID=A0AAJ5YQS1_9BASI|nr:general negative regulator of transcription subunit 5 [Malassezia yamatoensis]